MLRAIAMNFAVIVSVLMHCYSMADTTCSPPWISSLCVHCSLV